MSELRAVNDIRPQIIVLGGPNGAGKTTSARRLLPASLALEQFVNADLIARGLSPFAPESTAIQAGKLMLQRIRSLAERRESFAFETTLGSRTFARFLAEQIESGYFVHIIYVWLRSSALAISRVAERVRRGGHSVPDDVVARRFERGLRNFFEIYMPLASQWTLCDNSGRELVLIAQGNAATGIEIFDPARWQQIQQGLHS
ncbi:MAG TPA: zeta toxin family protein [Phycisphaerae bacterium]